MLGLDLSLRRRRPLSERLEPASGHSERALTLLGMITPAERRALSAFAERIWAAGARRGGLIIDGGPFVGASTVALAEGLARSPLSEAERRERIWSYDLFRTTPGMAASFFGAAGPQAGESFRPVVEANLGAFRPYVRVLEGDVREAPAPDRPVAILFLDMLWNWEATAVAARNFYPRLEPHRSVLVHQDFVYPFYPWIILSMGLLRRELPFTQVVEHSSAVFDVARPVRAAALDDPRNLSLPRALEIYDDFIGRLQGWGRGALTLGKALFLASHNRMGEARALTAQVAGACAHEPLAMQYVRPVLDYCARAEASGRPQPLAEASGV
jgi:hypothetical protein